MPVPTRSTLVGDLSEGEVLAWIQHELPDLTDTTIVGIGDDAAVLRFGGDVVTTTDTLVHGPDFRLAWSTGYDIGWKAVAVNVADVAAMGAVPTALLVALTLPSDTELGFVRDLYQGMTDACAALAPTARVVGGDLTASQTLTVAVTALGDLEGRRPVLRSGARPGDGIALIGTQGPAGRGLAVLFDRFRDAAGVPVPVDRSALTADELFWLDRQLRPVPPVAAGREAALLGATAMMDVSDGLVIDARRLARASGVVLDFHSAALHTGVREALFGGEDHALLVTFPAGTDDLPAEAQYVGVVRSGEPDVQVDGRSVSERGGWDPYQDWDAVRG